MKKILLLLLASGTLVSGTMYSVEDEGYGSDYEMVSTPKNIQEVDDGWLSVDKGSVEANRPNSGLVNSVKDEVKDAWKNAQYETGKQVAAAKKEMQEEFAKQRKEMTEQILAMVILFLRKELPSMVMNTVKSVVASPKGAMNKVKGWFGYGNKVAPQEESATTNDSDEALAQMLEGR